MKRNKIVVVLIGVIFVFVFILGVVKAKDLITLVRYRAIIKNMTIDDIDLSKINDGIYKGSSEAILVAADVEVTIQNHRISKIDLVRHLNGQGKPAEVMPDKVIKAQSLKVDTITGATSSSKVILKAIENALKISHSAR